MLGAVQSAFRQGGSHLAPQRPSIPLSNPGRHSHLLGPLHILFGHPSGHSDTQVLFLPYCESAWNPGKQIHTFGAVHCAFMHPWVHNGTHLFPSNTVGSFTYPDQQVHTFGAVQSALIQPNVHTGIHRLPGFSLRYPGPHRHVSGFTHLPPVPHPPAHFGIHLQPAGTEGSFSYPGWQVHCRGFK